MSDIKPIHVYDPFQRRIGYAGQLGSAPLLSYESNDAFIVQIPLPGLSAEQIEITLQGYVLLISQAGFAGRPAPIMLQSYLVPEGADRDRITAEYRDGILTIAIPKQRAPGPDWRRQVWRPGHRPPAPGRERIEFRAPETAPSGAAAPLAAGPGIGELGAPFLCALSLGLDVNATPLRRFYPMHVYLEESNPETDAAVLASVAEFAEAAGYEIYQDFPAVRGSLIKDWIVVTRDPMTAAEAAERLEAIRRTAELVTQGPEEGEGARNFAEAEKFRGEAAKLQAEAAAIQEKSAAEAAKLLAEAAKLHAEAEVVRMKARGELLAHTGEFAEKLGKSANEFADAAYKFGKMLRAVAAGAAILLGTLLITSHKVPASQVAIELLAPERVVPYLQMMQQRKPPAPAAAEPGGKKAASEPGQSATGAK